MLAKAMGSLSHWLGKQVYPPPSFVKHLYKSTTFGTPVGGERGRIAEIAGRVPGAAARCW